MFDTNLDRLYGRILMWSNHNLIGLKYIPKFNFLPYYETNSIEWEVSDVIVMKNLRAELMDILCDYEEIEDFIKISIKNEWREYDFFHIPPYKVKKNDLDVERKVFVLYFVDNVNKNNYLRNKNLVE